MPDIQEDFFEKLTAIHFPSGDIVAFEMHWEIHSKSLSELLFYPFTAVCSDRRLNMNIRNMSVPVVAPPKIQGGKLAWRYPDKTQVIDDTFDTTEVIDVADYNIATNLGTIVDFEDAIFPEQTVPFRIDWPNLIIYNKHGVLVTDQSDPGAFGIFLNSYMEFSVGTAIGFGPNLQWWRAELRTVISSHVEGGGVLFGRKYDQVFFVNLGQVKKPAATLSCDFTVGPWSSNELNVFLTIRCKTFKRKNIKSLPVNSTNTVDPTLATDFRSLTGFVNADFPRPRGFKFTVDLKSLVITPAGRFL